MEMKNVKVPEGINVDHFRVTVFGSARLKPGDEIYEEVYGLAKRIAENNMDIVTGGGPGLMQAGNSGHMEGRGGNHVQSFGLNIVLPHEQQENKHLDVHKEFERFSERLDYFMYLSNVVVVAPGGIGTLLELFYTWQLIQVHHMKRIPIILLGDDWPTLIKWIEKNQVEKGLVSKEDLHSIFFADDADEAMKIIEKAHEEFEKGDHENFVTNYKKYRID